MQKKFHGEWNLAEEVLQSQSFIQLSVLRSRQKKRGYSCTIPNTHISSQYQQQVPQTNNDCHDLQIIQCSILYLCGSYKILLCCIFWEKTHLALWNLTAKMACWLEWRVCTSSADWHDFRFMCHHFPWPLKTMALTQTLKATKRLIFNMSDSKKCHSTVSTVIINDRLVILSNKKKIVSNSDE